MATKKKNTSKAAAAATEATDAPAKRASTSSAAVGELVVYRDPDSDDDRPAIVIGVTEGGPAPKGSREEEDATFLDLVVFGVGGQAAAIRRTVRPADGDERGGWATE